MTINELCIVHTSVHNMFMLFVSMQCVQEFVYDPEFIKELQEKCDQLKATVSSHPLMYFLSIMYYTILTPPPSQFTMVTL